MPKDSKRRQLKIEADLTGDDALAQLIVALERIHDGLGEIREVVIRIDERAKVDARG